jgi:hypothetical protein
MKSYISTLAIYALVNNVSALKIEQKPDVYGPNGKDYSNEDAAMELSHIGIDIED